MIAPTAAQGENAKLGAIANRSLVTSMQYDDKPTWLAGLKVADVTAKQDFFVRNHKQCCKVFKDSHGSATVCRSVAR